MRGTLGPELLLLPVLLASRSASFVLGPGARGRDPARVLPRRRADPLRGAAALVLRHADLLPPDRLPGPGRAAVARRPAALGQPGGAVHRGACATCSTRARWPAAACSLYVAVAAALAVLARPRAVPAPRGRAGGGAVSAPRPGRSCSSTRRAPSRSAPTRRARSRTCSSPAARERRRAAADPRAARRDAARRAGRGGRDHRPQRRGQDVDAARARGDRPAGLRDARSAAAGSSPCSRSAPASGATSPAARTSTSTARCTASTARRSRRGSTRSSPSPSSATSSTCRCAPTRAACSCGSASRSPRTSTPTCMLIDEVLAVGDEAFQRKCLRAHPRAAWPAA